MFIKAIIAVRIASRFSSQQDGGIGAGGGGFVAVVVGGCGFRGGVLPVVNWQVLAAGGFRSDAVAAAASQRVELVAASDAR